MKVLITGASGFIGSRLRAALLARGHEVVGVARRVPDRAGGGAWLALDAATSTTADWRRHLQGIDVVVNAVGIFREHGAQRFDALHLRSAHALFHACVDAGVRRVLQVSALGADDQAQTPYHRSKKAADDLLLALPLDAVVVQPSLVFGVQGQSARLFLAWASLPVLPLPAGGRQALQPVHVDDAAQALVALAEDDRGTWRGRRIALVGPQPVTLAGYLQALRAALALPPARGVTVPAPWMALVGRIGDRFPALPFDSAAWQMLQRGNSAPADTMTVLLGRAPRDPRDFVEQDHADAHRHAARLAWGLPLLRLSLALMWIVTGIVSLGLYPVQQSYELLARAGVPSAWQPAMLYGAAGLDLLLGVLTLWPMRGRRWLWLSQAGLILFYTAVITLKLPEFWLHPYGPVLKNLPILAMLALLLALDDKKAKA
jgi:uncharacterized protein YbjT (DUF2867 family)/uncharacterized membrane protein YphA (DoxX/SURF4 family)